MVAAYWHRIRGLRREVWIVLTALMVRGFTWIGLTDTLLSLYLVRMGYGPAFVGVSAAVHNLGYALAAMPGSALTRRLGPRLGMVIGTLGWAIGLGLFSLADLLPMGWQPAWIIITRLLAAAGLALDAVSAQPYMADMTTPEERPYAFALALSLSPLGGFLGSLAAGLLPALLVGLGVRAFGPSLADARPYGATLIIGMLVYVPLLALLLTLPKPGSVDGVGVESAPGAGDAEVTHRWSRRAGAPMALFVAVAFICALRVGGEFTARTFFSVYLDATWAVPTLQIGGAVALASLLTIPAPLVTPALVARWGRAWTIAVGALGVAGAILLLGLVGHWRLAAGAFVVMTVLAAMVRSVWSLLVQESVSSSWRPTASGVTNLASGLGVAAMSSAGGFLAAELGYSAMFAAGAVLVGLGALVVVWAFGVVPRPATEPAALKVDLPRPSSSFDVQHDEP